MRQSILTTIFPQCGFHRATLTELRDDRADESGRCLPYKCIILTTREEREQSAIFPNIFAPLRLGGKLVRTHLYFEECEVAEIEGMVSNQRISPASTLGGFESGAKCGIVAILRNEGEVGRRLEVPSETLFGWCCELMKSPESNITLEMRILFWSGLEEEALREGMSKIDFLCHRKELFAQELITLYRRYISVIKLLAVAASAVKGSDQAAIAQFRALVDLVKPCYGLHDKSKLHSLDVHSTREDSWRLICSFRTIEERLEEFNADLENKSGLLLNLQDYMDSLTDGKVSAAEKFLALLKERHRIKTDISFKKVLEYFIYQRLPFCGTKSS